MKKVLTAIFAFLFLFSAVGGAAAYVNAEEDTELAKNCKAAYLFHIRNAASSHFEYV